MLTRPPSWTLAAALGLALALLAPGAAAFAAAHDEVRLAFDPAAAPIVVAAGDLQGAGVLRDALLLVSAGGSRFGQVPMLRLVEPDQPYPRVTEVPDATLVLHDGHLAWPLGNASLAAQVGADYALALALPEAPTGGESPGPGVILAGPDLRLSATGGRGETPLVVFAGVVTVFDADGKVLDGWDRRRVNEDMQPGAASPDEAPAGAVLFQATGPFEASLAAQAAVAGLGADDPQLRLEVRPAAETRFRETVEALTSAMETLAAAGGEGGEGPGAASDLEVLDALGTLLNGAVVVVRPPDDAEAPEPLEASLSGREVALGPVTVLRSQDLALAWEDGRMGVQGTSTVAVTADGFSTPAPAHVGPVPVLAIVLWLVAAGAVVAFFVVRPPKGETKWTLRLASGAVALVALAGVFWWWDASFAATFGTSVLTLLFEQGADASVPQLMLVLALETMPWGLAALLFALPVRIAVGVGLRYLGLGKSLKGVASASGLVALGVFGPTHALWLVNVVAREAFRHAGPLFGGG